MTAAPPRFCNNPRHSWGEPCARRPQCLGDKLPETSFFAPKSNADGRRLEWQQDKLLRYRLVLFMASLLASLACIVYCALISEESSMRTTRVGQSVALSLLLRNEEKPNYLCN